MKKLTLALLTLTLLLALTACGGTAESSSAAAPTATEAPIAAPAAPTQPAPEPTPAPVQEENAPTPFELAEACIEGSLEDLYAAVGEPAQPAEYASSCLGDGEDGILHYDGFTVYTYRDGESEEITAVLAD